MAGNAAQTSSERPAKISFLRPVASIALATRGSSKTLTDERSTICTPDKASTSSGIVGPPHAVPGRRGGDDRKLQRLRRFRKADDIMFKLSNRVVTHSAHE